MTETQVRAAHALAIELSSLARTVDFGTIYNAVFHAMLAPEPFDYMKAAMTPQVLYDKSIVKGGAPSAPNPARDDKYTDLLTRYPELKDPYKIAEVWRYCLRMELSANDEDMV